MVSTAIHLFPGGILNFISTLALKNPSSSNLPSTIKNNRLVRALPVLTNLFSISEKALLPMLKGL